MLETKKKIKIILFFILVIFNSCATTEKQVPVEKKEISNTDVIRPDEKTLTRKTKPRLTLFPFQRSENNIEVILSNAAIESIDLNMRLSGKYDLSEEVPKIPVYSQDSISAYCFNNEIDSAIYGKITYADSLYNIEYSIFDTVSNKVVYSDICKLDSVLDLFNAVDEISENILTRLSDEPLTFGNLNISGEGDLSEYKALLNDVEIPITGDSVKLISGEYRISVIDPENKSLLNESIIIEENKTTEVEIPSVKIALKEDVYVLPFKTIKIDGNKEDWEGIEPLFVDEENDSEAAKKRGYDLAAGFVCRDDEYLYWRMDFYDGRPTFVENTRADRYALTIGSYNMPLSELPSWDFSQGYDLEVMRDDGLVFSEIWSQTQKKMFRLSKVGIGPDFIEARFRLNYLKDFDHSVPIQAWMRIFIAERSRYMIYDLTPAKRLVISE